MRIHEVISETSYSVDLIKKAANTLPGKLALRAANAALGTGPTLATYAAELGPKVPSKGPQRGNEINTNTGKPWTQEQLDRYNMIYGTED